MRLASWDYNTRVWRGTGLICLLLALFVIVHDVGMASVPHDEPSPVPAGALTRSIPTAHHTHPARSTTADTSSSQHAPCHDPACPSVVSCGIARIATPSTSFAPLDDAVILVTGEAGQPTASSACRPEASRPRASSGRSLLVRHQVFII